MNTRRPWLSCIVVACAIAAVGCVRVNTGAPATPKGKKIVAVGGTSTIDPAVAGLPQQLATVSALTGKVKIISDSGGAIISNNGSGIISDNGGGIISNNSGNIVSNNGGGIISDNGGGVIGNNGGGIIANNGGSLTGKTKFGLLADTRRAAHEFLLADALVTVQDAAGKPVLDKSGNPFSAVTDKTGTYQFQSALPAGNFVLHIKIHEGGALSGGELTAMLPHQDAKNAVQPIDTSTSLGAAYVLGKYVLGDQATYNKLPASEADKLRQNLDDAKKLLTSVPKYSPEALASLTEDLRAKAPPVSQELDVIKALLLGQSRSGDGRQASTVALFKPKGLAIDALGNIYVGEPTFGRIRSIAANGLITTYADVVRGTVKQDFPGLRGIGVATDGTIYVISETALFTIGTDKQVKVLAGELNPISGSSLLPYCLAVGSDGTAYVGEAGSEGVPPRPPRVVAIAKDGSTKNVPVPADWKIGVVKGIALGKDGALYYSFDPGASGQDGVLYRGTPTTAPTVIATKLKLGPNPSGLAVAADGTVYVSEPEAPGVRAFAPDGTSRVVLGAGGQEGTQDLVVPSSLAIEPDGTLLVTDTGSGLVHSLSTGGQYRVVAGTTRAEQSGGGDLRSLAISAPTGVTFDSDGRMLVAETGNFQIARFDGTTFSTIAGGAQGRKDGPAKDALFSSPAGIAYVGSTLYIADAKNASLRSLTADGIVATVVSGPFSDGLVGPDERQDPATHYFKGGPMVAGPDKLLYWISQRGQILRQAADGKIELVAGTANLKAGSGLNALVGGGLVDGTAAKDAVFSSPRGLAFAPDGDLYIATSLDQTDKSEEGIDAKLANLAMPTGLVVDAKGNLYIAEIGTVSLPLMAAVVSDKLPFADGTFPPVAARVRKVTPDGKITTIAGARGRFFTDPHSEDALVMPTALALSPDGKLVIVDTGANLVRVLPAGSY
jgi:sugar lactone lactonase YvrE